MRGCKYSVYAVAMLLLAACATSSSVKNEAKNGSQEELPPIAPIFSHFDDWKADFIRRAIAAGIPESDVHRLIDPVSLNQQVISLDRKQPEFSKMPWAYADNAASKEQISNGQAHLQAQYKLLQNLQTQYGVPGEVITAIWGLESAYGQVTGSTNLANALSTLAYEGRRQAFAEEQLMALLTLLSKGDVPWSSLKGSWAGGMGQTQFIPGTWLSEGVDGDADGHRDPWNTADALTSTASYLHRSGWIDGLQPFYEVQLPENFDYAMTGMTQSAAQWEASGVVPVSSGGLPASAGLELWLPAGSKGPALLLSPNFRVIRVYNNSSSYALGVSLLAGGIAGKAGLQQSWPREEKPLSTAQVRQLQQTLTTAGYDTLGVDGLLGKNTRKAFQDWQRDHNQIADGFISQQTTQALLSSP